jgi:hypothetical protein
MSDPEESDRIERFDEFLDLLARDFGVPACCLVRLRVSLGSFAIASISFFVEEVLRVERRKMSITAGFVGPQCYKGLGGA